MTVQADTIRKVCQDRKRAYQRWKHDKVPRKATCQEAVRESGKTKFLKKGGNHMENKNFMTVDEVAQELNVSKSYAYKVVRELNAEMQKLGYLTVTGRVNTSFFRKKLCYSE
jgi:ribosomal protein S25